METVDPATLASLPLAGVRILGVTQLGAGPWALSLLSDLGAEVVKLETPVDGDEARRVPPFAADGDSLYFQSLNRGARSLTLDLRSPEGRAVLRRLAPNLDAVYDNLRGGQPARLGLDLATLGPANPRLVCCSLSGFGQTGPRAGEPGYDFLIQAYAGFMDLTGEPGRAPTRCGVSVVDFSAGLLSVLALMIGLHRAQRTGLGGSVDVSLHDTAIAMLNYLAGWTLNRDFHPARTADGGHQSLVPAQTFRSRDGHVVVMCMKEKFWRRLCDRLGRADLRDEPRFASFADRLACRAEVVGLIAAELAPRTTDEILGLLRGHVPCAPVYSVEDALEDEQTLAREMVIALDHPAFGRIRQVGSPLKLAGARPVFRPASALGADTEDVLRRIGGLSADEVAGLRSRGVV